jgi:hypothetical protein
MSVRGLAIGCLFVVAGCSYTFAKRSPTGSRSHDSLVLPIVDTVLFAAGVVATVYLVKNISGVNTAILGPPQGGEGAGLGNLVVEFPLDGLILAAAAAGTISLGVSAVSGFTMPLTSDELDQAAKERLGPAQDVDRAACAATVLGCRVERGLVVCQTPATAVRVKMRVLRASAPDAFLRLEHVGCYFTGEALFGATDITVWAYDANGDNIGTTQFTP